MYYDSRGIICFRFYWGADEGMALILNWYWCFTITWESWIMWNGNWYLHNSPENSAEGVCCTELFWFTTSKAIYFLSVFFSGIKKKHYLFKICLKEGRLFQNQEKDFSLSLSFFACLSCPFSFLTSCQCFGRYFCSLLSCGEALSPAVCASFCDSPLSAKRSSHSESHPHKTAN